MTGGAHATMQDAHNNHFFSRHAVENHMRALHHAAIPSSDIRATSSGLGELAQLPKPAVQVVDISNHLGVAPLFKRVGGDGHDIVLRTRRKNDQAHDG